MRNCWGWNAVWTGRSHFCCWEAAGGRWGNSCCTATASNGQLVQWTQALCCLCPEGLVCCSPEGHVCFQVPCYSPLNRVSSGPLSQRAVGGHSVKLWVLLMDLATGKAGFSLAFTSTWKFLVPILRIFPCPLMWRALPGGTLETWSPGVEISHTTDTLHANQKVSCNKQCFLYFFFLVLFSRWRWRRDIHNKGMTQKLDPGKCDCISLSLGLTA